MQAIESPLVSRRRVQFTALMFLTDMILFGVAVGLLDASTVVPDFVSHATHSEVLIGLAGVWFSLGWRIPQLFTAPMINRAPRKLPWMLRSSIPGRLMLIIVAAIVVTVARDNKPLILIVFFIGYGIFAFCDGIATNAWVELIGNATSDRARGVMFGVSQVVAGIIVLAVQPAMQNVLGAQGPGYPVNYAIIIGIAGVLLTVSLIAIANLRETPVAAHTQVTGLAEYAKYLRQVLRDDPPFRRFLLVRVFMDIATIATPFYIGYEVDRLKIVSAQAVSDSLAAVTIGSLVGSLLGSWLGGRYGSRTVIGIAIGGVLIQAIGALLSFSLGDVPLLITFAMVGMVNAAFGAGLFNWMVGHAPAGQRPTYNSISSTLGFIAMGMPVLGGLLLQFTGSYLLLFAIVLVFGSIAGVAALGLGRPEANRVSGAV